MTAISCKSLCRTFQQGEEKIIGLDHVTLDVDVADFVCLSGPSGSGKTTLLNAMGGLDSPDSGEIAINGQRIDCLDKGQLANMRLHKIGFVFQAYNLIPVLTAQENIEFVMQVQGLPISERRLRSTEVLREVGLEGIQDRLPSQLSGGQQQRVAVARAVVSKPTLILADEPTANLDSNTAIQLMELFVKLNQHHQTTFVISTHDQRIMRYAQRLIQMQDGNIISDELINHTVQ